MKTSYFLLVFMLIFSFLNSCAVADENLEWQDYSLKAEKKSELQKELLINLRVARPEDFNSVVTITESRIENQDGLFYLKTYYSNGFVSTSLLKIIDDEPEDPNLELEYAGTTCTSTSCTKGSECTPTILGDCTSCNTGKKDCTRSASFP